MARKPEDLRKRIAQPRTLAEMLLYLPDPARRVELEKYRIEYEALFGETDLTKRYTSTWPEEQQDWLMKHDMKHTRWTAAVCKSIFQGKNGDGGSQRLPRRQA